MKIITKNELESYLNSSKRQLTRFGMTETEYLNQLKKDVESGIWRGCFRIRKIEPFSFDFIDQCDDPIYDFWLVRDICGREYEGRGCVEFEDGCYEVWNEYRNWLRQYMYDQRKVAGQYLIPLGYEKVIIEDYSTHWTVVEYRLPHAECAEEDVREYPCCKR